MNKEDAGKIGPAITLIIGIVEKVLHVGIGLLLMFLIFGTAAWSAGWGYRWMPNMDTTKLAYLCGAWALYMWRR